MKPPEDKGRLDSHGAKERLRQHLQARLPADEVEEALRTLQLEPEQVELPTEEFSTFDDPAVADADGGKKENAARSRTTEETDQLARDDRPPKE